MPPEACITNPVEANLATQYDYYQYIPWVCQRHAWDEKLIM